MDLKTTGTTFNIDDVFTISISVFRDALARAKLDNAIDSSKQKIFSFYEQSVSYPIDELKDGADSVKVDFYEVIIIMTWAIYREWVKLIETGKRPLIALDLLDRRKVDDLFLENLNCEEGMDLYKKVRASSASAGKFD